MKRFIILFLLIKISTSAFCQTQSYSKLENQLNLLYKNNVTGKLKYIFINRFNKSIDISGFQVVLDSVQATYYFDNTAKAIYQNKVEIECVSNGSRNCLKNAINGDSSGLSIPFKNKSACYEFINILSEIKELMDNH
ncbi:MAG: hypothetical protein ACHQIM_15505 [Sphingobacteriales bacterium]